MTLHTQDKGWLYRVGCRVSAVASDVSAHPFAQMGVILFCALWWLIGLPTDILTAALSIMAITLTQMVLNRQNERELDAHRRDVAMHAKLDELVVAMKGARNEVAGIEDELDEEEIVELKRHVEEASEAAGDEDLSSEDRAAAHRRGAEARKKLAQVGKEPANRGRAKA
ncbi:MAG TPA: low affinity iron permease family protein [Sphingomicrobium sp.]|nr:low affinity iron permease family protein [Sphingomicrobium sp.]